jgi:hypothetical protein
VTVTPRPGTSRGVQGRGAPFRLQIANAATLIDTTHLHAFRAAADIDDAAAAAEKLSYVRRARVRANTAYAVTKIIPDEDNITPLKLASLAEGAQLASRQLW